MRVHVSIGIKQREDIPIVVLSQISDIRIIACQQLMQDVHDSRWRYPFSGVNATFKENSGIVGLKRDLDAFDLTILIRPTAHDDFHFVRILFS